MTAYRDSEILPRVLDTIRKCDEIVTANRRHNASAVRRFTRAGDRLRDFATVELLYDGFARVSDYWRSPRCLNGKHRICIANMCGCECHQ